MSLLSDSVSPALRGLAPDSRSNIAFDNNRGPDCREALYSLNSEILRKRIDGAYKVPIDMTADQLASVNEAIAPLVALPSDEAIENHAFSMHPVMFVQTYICEKILEKDATAQIGPNMFAENDNMEAHASCMKMDAREEYRVKKALLRSSDFNARMNNYLSGSACVDGAQKCGQPTERLACNNVLFWLTIKDLFEMFQRKALEQLHSAMVLPEFVKFGRDGEDQLNGIRIKHVKKNVLMSFINDDSMPYLHDAETWKAYAVATILDGHRYGFDFNIVVERYKRVGITHLLYLTRTQLGGHHLDHHYLSANTVRIYNIIPFMGHLADLLSAKWFRSCLVNFHTVHDLFMRMQKIEFPASLLSEVDAFLFDRRDNEIDRQHAGAILSSKMYSVIIGNYRIQKGMTMLLKDFAETCTLLIIRSFIARQMASRSIAFASAHVVKTSTTTGLWNSLKLLFSATPGLTEIGGMVLPDSKLMKSFSSKVMMDTPENELVRRYILCAEQEPVLVFEEIAKQHNVDYRKVPENKPYTYDPPDKGYCYQRCMDKCNADTDIQHPYPTLAEIKQELADKELEELPLTIEKGHCVAQLNTNDVCEHLVYNQCFHDEMVGTKYDATDYFDKWHYKTTDANTNQDKTSICVGDDGDRWVNVAAHPFNDQAFWAARKGPTHHWCIILENNRRILPHLGRRHTYTFSRNLLCLMCCKDLSDNVYADVGTSVAKRYLPGFILRVLRNLRGTRAYQVKKMYVKVQDYKGILESGRGAALLEEISTHWKVIKHISFAANEVVVTNEPISWKQEKRGLEYVPKFKPIKEAPEPKVEEDAPGPVNTIGMPPTMKAPDAADLPTPTLPSPPNDSPSTSAPNSGITSVALTRFPSISSSTWSLPDYPVQSPEIIMEVPTAPDVDEAEAQKVADENAFIKYFSEPAEDFSEMLRRPEEAVQPPASAYFSTSYDELDAIFSKAAADLEAAEKEAKERDFLAEFERKLAAAPDSEVDAIFEAAQRELSSPDVIVEPPEDFLPPPPTPEELRALGILTPEEQAEEDKRAADQMLKDRAFVEELERLLYTKKDVRINIDEEEAAAKAIYQQLARPKSPELTCAAQAEIIDIEARMQALELENMLVGGRKRKINKLVKGGLAPGNNKLEVVVNAQGIYENLQEDDCVINPASPNNAGGGYRNHSNALEEYMCNNSDLIEYIEESRGGMEEPALLSSFYGKHHELYSLDWSIVSMGVESDKCVRHNVITSVAPNLGNAKCRNWTSFHLARVWRAKMQNVIKAADEAGSQTLVMPAWGCGVFKNAVEDLVKYVVEAACGTSCVNLKKIILAMPDARNLKAAQKIIIPQPSGERRINLPGQCKRELKLEMPEWFGPVAETGTKRYFKASAEEFGALSNFAKTPIKILGTTYCNGESAFQLLKNDSDLKQNNNGKELKDQAKKAGVVKCCDRHALIVMAHIVEAKAKTHMRVSKLLSPADYYIENTNHPFWGKGNGDKGSNWLGKLYTMYARTAHSNVRPEPPAGRAKKENERVKATYFSKYQGQDVPKSEEEKPTPASPPTPYFDITAFPEIYDFFKVKKSYESDPAKCKAEVRADDYDDRLTKRNGGILDTPAADVEMCEHRGLALENKVYISPFHPAGPLGDDNSPYILRSDIPHLAGFKNKEFFANKLQLVDVAPCDCYAKLPFHGKVAGVYQNMIIGPKFPVVQPEFAENIIHFPASTAEIERLAQELKKERAPRFKKVHQECGALLHASNSEVMTTKKVNFVEGTYGSGKTQYMKKAILSKHKLPRDARKPDTFIIVTPNGALANEYRNCGMPAYSWSTGMIAAQKQGQNGYYDIYIDEVYLMDPRIIRYFAIYSQALYCIGDRRQMHFGSKETSTTYPDIMQMVEFEPPRLTVAFATPIDVVVSLNKTEPYRTTTMSRYINSVKVTSVRNVQEIVDVCDSKCEEKHKHTYAGCFDTLHAHTSNLPTVASIQGLRSETFKLFISSTARQLITKVQGQRLVAITRHTRELELIVPSAAPSLAKLAAIDQVVCGCKHVGARNDYTTPIGNLDITSYNVLAEGRTFRVSADPTAFANIAAKDKNQRAEIIRNSTKGHVYFRVPDEYMVNSAVHSKNVVEINMPGEPNRDLEIEKEKREMLGDREDVTVGPIGQMGVFNQAAMKLAPNQSRIADSRGFISIDKHRAIRDDRRITLKHAAAIVTDETKSTVSHLANSFGCRQLNNNNHTLATTVERYGANVRDELGSREAQVLASKLISGFKKFVDTKLLRAPTDEELGMCRAQALLRASAKQNQDSATIYGETSDSTSAIKCFNKPQLKAKVGEEAWLGTKVDDEGYHVKGGQMVSAQSKEINQIVAPYVNWAERIVFGAMRGGVIPGYGHSPAQFRKKITDRLRRQSEYRSIAETVSCDISEQDTSKSHATDLFMRFVYGECGVPDHVVDILEAPNHDWTMKTNITNVKVKYQYQSGRADTLFSNTMHTMGIIGMSYSFDQLLLALFQGDDCMLKATELRRTEDYYFRLKEDTNAVGDFVGFLVSDEDLYIDIPRVALKTLTRDVADKGRFLELSLATRDLLSLHYESHKRLLNVEFAAMKYKAMNKGDVQALYELLVSYSKQDNVDKFSKITDKQMKGHSNIVSNLLTTMHLK